MTGIVQQVGEQLVISAELVDVKDGSRIWGEQYYRKSSDIFSLQNELASEISEKLRLRLSGEQREKLTKRFTENREAYEFYLKGRYAWGRRAIEDLKKGVEYFRQAIAEDPTAHQWHGEYLVSMGLFDQGIAELKKARDLDPLLAHHQHKSWTQLPGYC